MTAGLCGLAAAVGCSADGASDFGGALDETPSGPLAPPSPTARLPEAGPMDLDASTPKPKEGGAKDGAAKDGATKDSAVDARPPSPVPGTTCTIIDEIRMRRCGACGEQAAVCLGTGVSGTWSEYNACSNEVVNGCIPGTSIAEPCGNCGTRMKTCSQFCAISTSVCAGEPLNSCVPGSVSLTNAGCVDANAYHQRTCSATCMPGNFGLSCDPAPTTLEVPPSVGSVNSTVAVLSETQVSPRLLGTCPLGSLSTPTPTPYVYLSVHNPTAKTTVVSIYNSMAVGGAVIKTLLASYGAAIPADDAARKACVKGTNSFGTSALTGNSSFASLDGPRAVTLAPDETVVVYLAAYNAFVPATPALSTGKVMLNVRTEQLN